MSLTVKHLNSDSSFLLTFEPASPFPPSSPSPSKTGYTILLDPWIVGPSNIFHRKFSTTRHTEAPCIASLTELPEPDLVIISQSKSDHCNKETLTQLPASGGKTIILAEPGAAKVIRRWKYFDPEKVVSLPKWQERKPSTIHRITIPALASGGTAGEVTIAFFFQKADITGLHSAVGITYRSPAVPDSLEVPPTPPLTPKSFSTNFSHKSSNISSNKPLSVLYAPHGITYKSLQPYISSHLVSLAALPLTALLHSFDRVQNLWFLGGNICSGFPGGLEIAQNLCARAWISAHDGEKEIKGIANGNVEIRKFEREEVESVVSPMSAKFPGRRTGTEAIVLGVGEEIRLSNAMGFGPEERERDDPFVMNEKRGSHGNTPMPETTNFVNMAAVC